ncbi:MAG: hypothetical protein COB67_02085 [SAR324 cluster bacterium]|uniref:DUF374 domain-containing protein n=1 Tax=SAR324 cluster bacterium TaxID=2024889 RepID=A0A2A4T9I0_9DELT|nr:MAG: hypothetical protein COB67_02085 [SAR324 cluster bacterium]
MAQEKTFKHKLTLYLVPKILKYSLFLIAFTCRKEWVGLQHVEKLKEQNQSWIYSSWHGNIAFLSWAVRGQNIAMLVSESKDGEMIATAIESMGNTTIRGSSSKGGARALLKMIRWLKKGKPAAITPDGPRGPRHRLQSGVITLAEKSGAPLVPLHFHATRQWIAHKSWDLHQLPKPFSTIVIRVGEPYWVAPKLSTENFQKAQQEFEEIMLENVRQNELTIQSQKEA